MIAQLPSELIAGILATATPTAILAAANSAELAQAVHADPLVALAWTHHILALSDESIMNVGPARWWPSPADMDTGEYPDTRGLPTPATWLMKRLVRGLMSRQIEYQNTVGVVTVDLALAPSPFTVPAVVDDMLRPSRYRSIAALSLEEVVGKWNVPHAHLGESSAWMFDAPDPVAARLASPRLRPVPEALQLPGLYLFTGELDRFFDVTRRLATLLPTLAIAKMPLTLWTRLGIDDREITRRRLSAIHNSSTGDTLPEITLPMYWAMVAASEGRASILEFLVTEIGLNAHALSAFLSLESITSYFLPLLVQFSADGRVFPTWHWLLDHGYHYPAEQCGLLVRFVARTAEYTTLSTFFREVDKPRILAVSDLVARKEQFQNVITSLWGWAPLGQFDLLLEFGQLGLLTVESTFHFLTWVKQADHDRIGREISPVFSSLDGGVDALVEFGLTSSPGNVHRGILVAHLLQPDRFPERMLQNHDRPLFLDALMSIQSVQALIDHAALVASVLEQIGSDNGKGPDGAFRAPLVTGIGRLMLRSLCDPGPLGTSSWSAVHALSPALHMRLFGVLVHERLGLDFGDDDPPPAIPNHATSALVAGWTAWQFVLDGILPPSLASDRDLTGDANMVALLDQGVRGWRHHTTRHLRPTENNVPRGPPGSGSQSESNNPWLVDQPTAAVVAALAVDPNRYVAGLPLWVVARLCTLAPHVVLAAATFSPATPMWMWQLRLDAPTATPVPGVGRIARLEDWEWILDKVLADERREVALLVLRVVVEETRIHGGPLPKDGSEFQALMEKWPVVLEQLAREAEMLT
ncbi:hypothetical protein BC828DRAFT_405049 [Blastocladiella britannica]|nr:hypothetical protein BC828DRAFT_405049 [Blastocladiella britannica]